MALSWCRLQTKNGPFTAMMISRSRGTCLIGATEFEIHILLSFSDALRGGMDGRGSICMRIPNGCPHHLSPYEGSRTNLYRPSLPFLSPSQTKTTSPQETSPGDVVLLDGSPDFTVRATSQIFRVSWVLEKSEKWSSM